MALITGYTVIYMDFLSRQAILRIVDDEKMLCVGTKHMLGLYECSSDEAMLADRLLDMYGLWYG